MTQTVAAYNASDMYITLSGVNISGSGNNVELNVERAIGETYTYDGENSLAVSGKKRWSGSIRAVYTEVNNEALDVLIDAQDGGSAVPIELIPKGSATGNWKFTGNVIIGKYTMPLDGTSADPILVSFDFVGSGVLTKGTVG